MKRIRTYRFWNITVRVLAGLTALQFVLSLLKVWRYPAITFLTVIAVFIALACELFAIACPFCNRPLPEHVFKQPSTHTCEFCGKEIDIV